MEQGFPPVPPPSVAAIALHVALLVFAVLAVVGLFVKSRRPARVSDILWWVLAVGVATVLCVAGSARSEAYRPFLIGYAVLVWGVAGVGCIITVSKLIGQGGSGAAVGWVLIALAGLGVIIALSLPGVPCAREAARRTQCRNNLKQIGLAMHTWYDEHERLPDAIHREPDQPPQSWRVTLLPQVEQPALYQNYDPTKAWDDPANLPVARTQLPVYLCPSDLPREDAQGRSFTSYLAVTGPETAFPDGKGLTFKELDDGTANTLLVAEACGRNFVWTDPVDFDATRDPAGVNLRGRGAEDSPGLLSSYHTGGANALTADGSVRFLNERIDPAVLKALTTRAGGERVDDGW